MQCLTQEPVNILLNLFIGFGPFGCHQVNASWVAVQELKKIGLGDDADLVVEQIPVEYETVKNVVPQLWKKHNPVVGKL